MKKQLLKLWEDYLTWNREKNLTRQDKIPPSFGGFMAWIQLTLKK